MLQQAGARVLAIPGRDFNHGATRNLGIENCRGAFVVLLVQDAEPDGRDWLARRGIAYLLVVSPNKSTVYPEFMPPLYPRHRTTRMDQLAEHLGRHVGGFPLLDLRPVLAYFPAAVLWLLSSMR